MAIGAGGADSAQLHELAMAENEAGRPARAARLLRSALRRVGGSDPLLQARVLISLAASEAELFGADRGLAVLAEADQLARAHDLGGLRAPLANQRGVLLLRSGQTAEALVVYRAAEPWLSEADPRERCRIWLNRGGLYMLARRLREARLDLGASAEMARQAGLVQLEAKALYNLGYVEFLAGDLPEALRLMDQADRLGADFNSGVSLLDRARVLIEAGLDREADSSLEEAASIFEQAGVIQDLGEVELARAECALLAGEADAARRLALRARRRFRRRGNERWRRAADRLVITAELMRGRPTLRLVAAARGLATELAAEGIAGQARSVSYLAAEALLELGRPEEALALAMQARPAGRSEPISARLHTRYLRARLRTAASDTSAAAREIRIGLAELAAYQASFGSVDLQTASAVHGRRLAELGLSVALQGGRPADVLAAAERGRAVSSRLAPIRPPADEHAALLLAELRQVIEESRAAEGDRVELARLGTRRRELEREIKARSWTRGGAGGVAPPASVSAIRTGLRETGSTLVSYVQTKGRLHAVVVSPRRVEVRPLAGMAEVADLVRRVRADLDVLANDLLPGGLRAAATGSLHRSLAALDGLLLAPLGLGDTRVVVSPTGVLATLPWGSLPSLRGAPVTVTPTATAWLGARVPARLPVGDVVAFAGPDLLRSRDEAAGVAAVWTTEPILGVEATRHALVAELAARSIVHIAAHGTHQTENPLFSSIRLADGPLFAHELTHCAPHVVLSACDLGLATVRPGDEALGLTSVLLHQGARCVVAGVARVADDAAAAVMIDYHSRLARGEDTALALAGALAGEPDRPTPFVCFGAEWTAV